MCLGRLWTQNFFPLFKNQVCGLATLEFLDDLATPDVLTAEPKLVSFKLEFPLPSVSILPPKLLQDDGKLDSEFMSQISEIIYSKIQVICDTQREVERFYKVAYSHMDIIYFL